MKRNELQRHKKSDKVKWTLTAVAFMLFAVLIAGVCLQVFGKGKVQPSEWFKKAEKQTEQTEAPVKSSAIRGAMAAAKEEPVELFSNCHPRKDSSVSINYASSFNSWYSSVPDKENFEYVVTMKIDCIQNSPFCDSTDPPAFVLRIAENNGTTSIGFGITPVFYYSADTQYKNVYRGYTIGSCSKNVYSYDSIADEPPSICFPLECSFAHSAHRNSEYTSLPSILFSLTAYDFTVYIQEGSSKKSVYSCPKGSENYNTYYSYCQNGGYFQFNDLVSLGSDYMGVLSLNSHAYTLEEHMYVIPRSTVTLPEDPVKEGHTFAGWYYGTQAEHEENCRAYDGAPIYEDTELHAHFNINRYTVTYDVAGGTPVNSMVLDWNTVAEKPTVSRTGYNFLGWYLSDGTEYSNQPIKEDTTLIAHWEIKTFTVTFYVGEEKHAELTVDYGTTLKELTEEAQAMNLQVMSLRASNGAPINIGENGLTEDVDVQAEVMTGADKLKNTVKNNWLTIVLSVVGLVALVVIISTLFSRKKKIYHRR